MEKIRQDVFVGCKGPFLQRNVGNAEDTSSCYGNMGWLWLVGSNKLYVSFAKEPYNRDDILQKRPILSSILLTIATP